MTDYPKVIDVKLTDAYTCQKCGDEFRTGIEREIIRSVKPLCPKCQAIWRRGTL